MLSRRAQEQVPSNAFNEMWDVMKNPWDRHDNPGGAVNLGVAENQLMQAELKEFVARHPVEARGSGLTYQEGPAGSARLRAALARFLSRQLATHAPLEAGQIVVTNGVSSALEHAAWALADAGEAFLLGRPYYGEVTLALRAQVRTVPVAFGAGVDPLGPAAVGCYEAALLRARAQGQAVRGLLLCSPHNPLGRCYPRAVLAALLRLCERHQLHLVSDEVYALSVWRAPAFTSVLALDPAGLVDPARVHVLWGVSKDFGANGWRLGCLVSAPRCRPLRAALGAVAIYSYASSLADGVVARLLEDDAFTAAYLAESRRRLAAAHAFTADFLRRHAIPFAPGAHAALFIWADLGTAYRRRHPRRARAQGHADAAAAAADAAADDTDGDVREALRRQRVYLAAGDSFNSETPGMFRIVFAHPRDRLEEGLRRIHQALESGVADRSAPGVLSMPEIARADGLGGC